MSRSGRKWILVGLGVLIISALAAFSVVVRASDQRIACETTLRSIGGALQDYARTYGRMPNSLDNPEAFMDFSHPEKWQTCPANGTRYVYLPQPPRHDARTIIALDAFASHYGNCGNVLFADGHVECVNSQNYPVMIERSVREFVQSATSQRATSLRVTSEPARFE